VGSDFFNLSSIGIRSFGDLVFSLFGETNDEASEDGSIHSFNFTYGFNQRLPFSDERAKFVSGHIHTIERGSAGVSIDIFDLEFNFSPCHVIRIVFQISQRDFDDSSFDHFGSDSGTGSLSDTSLSERFRIERSRGFEIEPVFSSHRVDDFLFSSFLAFR